MDNYGLLKIKIKFYLLLEGVKLLSRLFCIQEFGIFNQDNPKQFDEISEKIIQKRKLNFVLEIFKIFLARISSEQSM